MLIQKGEARSHVPVLQRFNHVAGHQPWMRHRRHACNRVQIPEPCRRMPRNVRLVQPDGQEEGPVLRRDVCAVLSRCEALNDADSVVSNIAWEAYSYIEYFIS